MSAYRSIAIAGLAFLAVGSAHGMNAPAIPQPDGLITQIAAGCGPGRSRVNGICVARTTQRQVRRAARRCVRWQGGACILYR